MLMGAAFLMGTSAIGPGFLTQTTVFTQQLAASFGFVILVSIVLDIGAQLNVWRIIAVSEKRGQDIANVVLPGLGYLISFLIVMGGLAFNIGNLAGAGLGLNVLFGGLPTVYGAAISAVIAIGIFMIREAGKAMDRFTQVAGVVMILLTVYVVIISQPPVVEAAVKTIMPDTIDFLSIVTLVGGTVGGYITFAGGHRLIEAGITGTKSLPEVTRSSVTGILITGIMRVLLFLAAFGVVAKGLQIDMANPAPSVFKLAAGQIGYKIFGVIMWSAAITSVIGSAYTSVSFIRTFSPFIEKNYRVFIIIFILISFSVFAIVGQPVKVLILVGALNGLILPITLGVLLIGAHNKKVVHDYKHPRWLTAFGGFVVILMSYMGVYTLVNNLPKLFN